MTPADYLGIVVLPTLAEFLAEPEDQRRAYLACIAAAHLADHVARARRVKASKVREAVASVSPYVACCLEIVDGIANGTKHAGPSREAAFKFAPGHEQPVPAFSLDVAAGGLDEGRWNLPGLVVGHRISDGSNGFGGYFIDDCACVVVRSYAAAFPDLLGASDLTAIAPELDHAAWFSAMTAAMSKAVP